MYTLSNQLPLPEFPIGFGLSRIDHRKSACVMSGCNVPERIARAPFGVSSRERYHKILTRTLIIISSLLDAKGPLGPHGWWSQLTLAPANWQTYSSYVSHVPAATYDANAPRTVDRHPFTISSPPLAIYINSSSYFCPFNPLGSACERSTRTEHASSVEPSSSAECNVLWSICRRAQRASNRD